MTSSSARRLLRDLKQWKQCSSEVPTIDAQPLENNIYEWHANMMAKDGLLKGISFHLIIHFPKNYPSSPPSIELVTCFISKMHKLRIALYLSDHV